MWGYCVGFPGYNASVSVADSNAPFTLHYLLCYGTIVPLCHAKFNSHQWLWCNTAADITAHVVLSKCNLNTSQQIKTAINYVKACVNKWVFKWCLKLTMVHSRIIWNGRKFHKREAYTSIFLGKCCRKRQEIKRPASFLLCKDSQDVHLPQLIAVADLVSLLTPL